jgi:hypothetical protein
MDLSGRPLLDTQPDRELFGDRERELSSLLASVERRLNVLVFGERGSGKTSLLRQVAFEFRQSHPDEPSPIFVEGSLANDAGTFLDLVRYRFGLSPLLREPGAIAQTLGMMSGRGEPVVADTLRLTQLVSSLRQAAGDTRRVVLVDELPVSLGQTIFGQLRDDLWQHPITWIVGVSADSVGRLLSPPAGAFFEASVELPPLTREQQSAILAARAGERGRSVARKLDEGNVRRLLTLAREALEGHVDPSALIKAQRDRDERASRLGRSASMLVAELESLGPVSASDEALLKRLGWTRNRAVQVFRQLEDARLVTSSLVKGGAGRPRKVYRLMDVPGVEDGRADL